MLYKKKGNVLYLRTDRIKRNKLIKLASIGILISCSVLFTLTFTYLVINAIRP